MLEDMISPSRSFCKICVYDGIRQCDCNLQKWIWETVNIVLEYPFTMWTALSPKLFFDYNYFTTKYMKMFVWFCLHINDTVCGIDERCSAFVSDHEAALTSKSKYLNVNDSASQPEMEEFDACPYDIVWISSKASHKSFQYVRQHSDGLKAQWY